MKQTEVPIIYAMSNDPSTYMQHSFYLQQDSFTQQRKGSFGQAEFHDMKSIKKAKLLTRCTLKTPEYVVIIMYIVK
jgi:hypothetical protein